MELKQLTEEVALLSREIAAFIRIESAGITEANVANKSHNNLVSHVDTTAEQRFVDGLKDLLPEAGFIAEEDVYKRQFWSWTRLGSTSTSIPRKRRSNSGTTAPCTPSCMRRCGGRWDGTTSRPASISSLNPHF